MIVCNSITKTFNVPGVILSNLLIPAQGNQGADRRNHGPLGFIIRIFLLPVLWKRLIRNVMNG